jgi:hypothetical protein
MRGEEGFVSLDPILTGRVDPTPSGSRRYFS